METLKITSKEEMKAALRGPLFERAAHYAKSATPIPEDKDTNERMEELVTILIVGAIVVNYLTWKRGNIMGAWGTSMNFDFFKMRLNDIYPEGIPQYAKDYVNTNSSVWSTWVDEVMPELAAEVKAAPVPEEPFVEFWSKNEPNKPAAYRLRVWVDPDTRKRYENIAAILDKDNPDLKPDVKKGWAWRPNHGFKVDNGCRTDRYSVEYYCHYDGVYMSLALRRFPSDVIKKVVENDWHICDSDTRWVATWGEGEESNILTLTHEREDRREMKMMAVADKVSADPSES